MTNNLKWVNQSISATNNQFYTSQRGSFCREYMDFLFFFFVHALFRWMGQAEMYATSLLHVNIPERSNFTLDRWIKPSSPTLTWGLFLDNLTEVSSSSAQGSNIKSMLSQGAAKSLQKCCQDSSDNCQVRKDGRGCCHYNWLSVNYFWKISCKALMTWGLEFSISQITWQFRFPFINMNRHFFALHSSAVTYPVWCNKQNLDIVRC